MPIRRPLTRLTLLLVLALPVLGARPAKAPPAPPASLLEGLELFSIDTPHSEVGFTVPWMGISRVHGTFQEFLGTIGFDTRDLTRSSVLVIIHTKSIDTNFERRDKDLKGADFFDVERFPTIEFESREIVRSGSGFLLRGPLTIRGVTKEIEIPFTFNGRIKDAGADDRIGFEGRLSLKRKDYGVTGPPRMNVLLEKGIIIGEDVEIPIAIEGWRAAPRDTMRDPVADSLYRAVLARGVPAVAAPFRALRAHTPDSLLEVDEGTINAVGYQLLSRDRASEAAEIFRLEIESWPANAFGYVGLGQSYAVLGNRELAIATLEKAVAITPEVPRARVLLHRLKG